MQRFCTIKIVHQHKVKQNFKRPNFINDLPILHLTGVAIELVKVLLIQDNDSLVKNDDSQRNHDALKVAKGVALSIPSADFGQ